MRINQKNDFSNSWTGYYTKLELKEKRLEYARKPAVIARRKEKIICSVCYRLVARGNYAKHQKTKRCKNVNTLKGNTHHIDIITSEHSKNDQQQ